MMKYLKRRLAAHLRSSEGISVHVQEEIIYLEPNGQEYIDSKRMAKPIA